MKTVIMQCMQTNLLNFRFNNIKYIIVFDNDILIIKVRITPINFFTLRQFSIFATCPFHNFVFRKLPDQLPGVQRRCGERSRLLGKENILLNFNSLGNKIIASIIQWGPLLAWVIFT